MRDELNCAVPSSLESRYLISSEDGKHAVWPLPFLDLYLVYYVFYFFAYTYIYQHQAASTANKYRVFDHFRPTFPFRQARVHDYFLCSREAWHENSRSFGNSQLSHFMVAIDVLWLIRRKSKILLCGFWALGRPRTTSLQSTESRVGRLVVSLTLDSADLSSLAMRRIVMVGTIWDNLGTQYFAELCYGLWARMTYGPLARATEVKV